MKGGVQNWVKPNFEHPHQIISELFLVTRADANALNHLDFPQFRAARVTFQDLGYEKLNFQINIGLFKQSAQKVQLLFKTNFNIDP